MGAEGSGSTVGGWGALKSEAGGIMGTGRNCGRLQALQLAGGPGGRRPQPPQKTTALQCQRPLSCRLPLSMKMLRMQDSWGNRVASRYRYNISA